MKAYLTGRLGKVHRGLFQYVALLGNALQFSLQSQHLVRLSILCFALDFGHAIPLCPPIDTVDTDANSLSDLGCWVSALKNLLDRSDLKFFRVTLPLMLSPLPKLWLRSV
jgi:hypothetical protein